MVAPPLLNNLGILIDAYVNVRGPLISKNEALTEKRLMYTWNEVGED